MNSNNKKAFIGFQMVGWFGIIEDRTDPYKLGRVRVRIYGWHTDNKSLIPTEDLPWATPVGVLDEMTEGTMVFGIFADGEDGQQPIVLGAIAGIPTTTGSSSEGFRDPRTNLSDVPRQVDSRNASTDGSGVEVEDSSGRYPRNPGEATTSRYLRNSNIGKTIIGFRRENLDQGVTSGGGTKWSEPYPAYNTFYPFSRVLESESGHVFELDDTPDAERVALAHRTGTNFEIYPSGTKVEKIVKNNYQIIYGEDFVHIMGRTHVTVDGDANILVKGDAKIDVGNDTVLDVAGNLDAKVGDAFRVKADTIKLEASNINLKSKTLKTTGTSSIDIKSGGAITIDGSVVDFISPATTASASGLDSANSKRTKNRPKRYNEKVPVPRNVSELDYISGVAYKEQQMGELLSLAEASTLNPSVSITEKEFDTKGKAFIAKADWAVSQAGYDEIKHSEGFRSEAYVDPGTGGEPITIGYGTTGAAINRPIKLGETVTEAQAEIWLKQHVDDVALDAIKDLVDVELTQGMIDALASFIYNVGVGNFKKSTLLKRLNAGDYEAAGNEFMKWTKAAGRVLKGLVIRREAERDLFFA